VRRLFRVTIIKRTVEDGLAFLQAYGHGNTEDPDDQELLQEADLDHAQHFGFKSGPPADTEAIVCDPDGGLSTVAEVDSVEDLDTHGTADQMPDVNSGDTCIYSQDGTYIFLDADGKLTIKAMTDNVEIITEAGKQIKLGQDGATYRDIAYAHNTEAGASKVASGATLNTWTHDVESDIAALKVDIEEAIGTGVTKWGVKVVTALNLCIAAVNLAHGLTLGNAPTPPGETLTPNTTDGINTDVDHSYVSSGSTKAEVEP